MADPVTTSRGRPIAEFLGYYPVLVWDDYHGFVVGKREAMTGRWMTDLPYAFESGGKEIEIDPVLWWPLPAVPEHARASDPQTTRRRRPRIKTGRWFVNFNPGPSAVILEWRPEHGLFARRYWWLSAHFGPLPDQPWLVRWRLGPLILDRYRMEAAHG